MTFRTSTVSLVSVTYHYLVQVT